MFVSYRLNVAKSVVKNHFAIEFCEIIYTFVN